MSVPAVVTVEHSQPESGPHNATDTYLFPTTSRWTALMSDVLISAALVIASVDLLVGMMLAWGISGGDGTGTPLMGFLGISVLVSTVASFLTIAGLLAPVPRFALLAALAVLVMGTLFAFAAVEDRNRRIGIGIGIALLVVVTLVVVGALADGREVPIGSIAVTALPALLTAVSLLVDRMTSDAPDSDTGTITLAFAALSTPPLLLMLASSM